MKSPVWIFIVVFGGIGVVILGAAGAVAVSTLRFRANAQQAEGTVVALDTRHGSKGSVTYAPVFEFTDLGGRTHRVTSDNASRPATHDVGEKAIVYFDPEHPDEARLDGFMANWFLPTIIAVFGSVFGGIGGGFLFFEAKRLRHRAALRRTGRRTACRLVKVEHDTSMRINGRHPWLIRAQHKDPYTGKTHTYRSETIYFDPAPFVTDTVDVLVDPHDPKKYWVDVAAIEARRAGRAT